MSEYGDKVPEDKKGAIEEALAELKEAHKMQDLDKIDDAMNKMNTAWQAASQDIYQASQQDQPADANGEAADGASENGTEEVTDVEFEEVDDK